MASRSVPKYCCYLQSVNTGAHGSGFIVELKDLQTANLLALNWEKRGKTGELQTDYALITSHDTIPGSSLSELNRWTVWCQSIKNGNEQILSDLVCGVISCCGAESLLAGHTAETTVTVFRPHPGKASCDIQLNITILFLNSTFAVLSTVSPPMILVKEYLDQNAYTQLHQRIITTGRNSCVSYCDGVRSVKTASLSVVEQQRTSEHGQELAREMIEFEKFQKLESNATMKVCHGSPVYLNPDTDTDKVIGVHVGETVTSQQLVVTFHGILRLLQGGLIPVLSVLHCLDLPKAWVSRWGYLITPYIDQMKRMESDYLCEVLDFLLKKRHGTPLVKLPVDLVDVDNEASLDLLCAVFKHFRSADNADLNQADTKLNLKDEINAYITRLCKDVIHLLELGTKLVADRTTLVEKCLTFYNLLLDFKFAEITEQILCTSQNVELLKNIIKRYKHSDVVQENVIDIILKSLDRHPLSVEELLTLVDQILPQDVVDSLKESASGNVQTTLEEVQRLLHQEKIVSSLRQLLNSGYPLSSKEVQDLIQILPQDVIDSLEKSGLDLKTSGNIQTTLKEVRRLLDQHENVSSLRKFLDSALEIQSHYEAYQQVLKEEVAIPLKYLKVLFFGPPRTGKTSMRRRLIGEIQNLANEPLQASTGTAKCYDAIVKETVQGDTEPYDSIVKVEDRTTNSLAFITKSEWSNVKTLFGKEKNVHETDLDEELQLLYQFIYAFPVVSQTENKNSTSPINRSESSDSRSPEEEAQDEVTKQGSANVKTDTVSSPVPSKPGSNTSISTARKVSSVREHDQQMTEIETAFKAFDKVLHTAAGRQEILELLDGTIFMNMVDTGGHPAFLEMLPALTMGPALYLIFFRLDQELKKSYKIWYVSEDKKSVQVGESSYTVEEVIFQALSSIACFSCTEPMKNMPNSSHAAMLMGTHKDQLGSNPETVKNEIKSKDAALQTSLREVLETGPFEAGKIFLHYAFGDQLMFAIDNMTGDDKELKEVHERLEKIIKQEFDKHSIPASWLMFNIFLRKMGNRTMSLSQCHEIGGRLEVRDTNEALWFLHHCVGTLMHFPDVEGIKDVVICDPQVVFDSVTDLILNSFNLKQGSGPIRDHFEKTGQFSFKHIQKIASNSKSDHLPLLKLGKLLEHLNIIAPIRPECHSSGPQSDTYQKEVVYFMPAVLKHATEEELHMEQSPTDPVPLMIHFKCGFVPVGVFCAMIASLVAQKDTLGWILLEPRDGHILFKNKVTFRINGAYNITLISKPKQYEIHIARIADTERALEEICQHVLETVCGILDKVILKLKYKQLMSSNSDQTLYELGFKCPKHPDDDHLVINRPKGGVKSRPSQSAISLWSNCLAIERQSTMICLKEQIFIGLRHTCLPKPFVQQSLVWFGEATEISSASPDLSHAKGASHGTQSHAKELDVMEIVNVLHEAQFADGDWMQLGLQLIDHAPLKTISANWHGNSSLCMIDTISQWLRTDSKPSWEKLAKAVTKVGEYGEATADIVRQKGGIVRTAAETIQSPQEGVSSQLSLTSKVPHTHKYVVEKPGRATGGKRKQSEEKQHKVPKKRCLSDVAYVEKPVRATTRKRKQSGKEQGVPKKRHSTNVTSAAATHTPSLATTDDGMIFLSSESTTSSNQAVAETETIFSKPQIKDLIDALFHEVADKWKIIGVLLEIPKGKLASIAENYHDPQKCLLAMLETWLERVHPPPTWAAIIEAVEFLGEEQLGKTLRDTYTQ